MPQNDVFKGNNLYFCDLKHTKKTTNATSSNEFFQRNPECM